MPQADERSELRRWHQPLHQVLTAVPLIDSVELHWRAVCCVLTACNRFAEGLFVAPRFFQYRLQLR